MDKDSKRSLADIKFRAACVKQKSQLISELLEDDTPMARKKARLILDVEKWSQNLGSSYWASFQLSNGNIGTWEANSNTLHEFIDGLCENFSVDRISKIIEIKSP